MLPVLEPVVVLVAAVAAVCWADSWTIYVAAATHGPVSQCLDLVLEVVERTDWAADTPVPEIMVVAEAALKQQRDCLQVVFEVAPVRLAHH